METNNFCGNNRKIWGPIKCETFHLLEGTEDTGGPQKIEEPIPEVVEQVWK